MVDTSDVIKSTSADTAKAASSSSLSGKVSTLFASECVLFEAQWEVLFSAGVNILSLKSNVT